MIRRSGLLLFEPFFESSQDILKWKIPDILPDAGKTIVKSKIARCGLSKMENGSLEKCRNVKEC